MKGRHGLGVTALAVASLIGSALVSGTAGAAPRSAGAVPNLVPLPVVCTLELPPPRVDDLRAADFMVHSTGVVGCDAVISQLDGKVELLRNGTVVQTRNYSSVNTSGASAKVQVACVAGAYQARMTAHWVPEPGSEGSDSTASPIVNLTC